LALAIVVAVVLPVLLLSDADRAVKALASTTTEPGSDVSAIAKAMPSPLNGFRTANDYTVLLVALEYVELERGTGDRFKMKAAVMRIGFAISCVGLVFMALGLGVGGTDLKALGLKLKTASPGMAVFALGAVLAGMAGIQKVEVQGPGAELSSVSPVEQDRLVSSLALSLSQCDAPRYGPARARCRQAVVEKLLMQAEEEAGVPPEGQSGSIRRPGPSAFGMSERPAPAPSSPLGGPWLAQPLKITPGTSVGNNQAPLADFWSDQLMGLQPRGGKL
jgi:hypothetical protein